MASNVYDKYLVNVQAKLIDIVNDSIKAALLDIATYTYSTAHNAYTDLTGVTGTPVALASKTNGTVGKGVIDAADTTITAVGAGVALGAVALYDDTSTPKYLISYNELTSPITPNGGDITLVWNAGGIFSI